MKGLVFNNIFIVFYIFLKTKTLLLFFNLFISVKFHFISSNDFFLMLLVLVNYNKIIIFP